MLNTTRREHDILVAIDPTLPNVLLHIADALGDDQPEPWEGKPLVALADETAAADPLTRLEIEIANDKLTGQIAAYASANALRAVTILNRWGASNRRVVKDVLRLAEAEAIANWANRRYATIRSAELADAGNDVRVGAAEGLDHIDELLGLTDSTSELPPGVIPLSTSAALFAYVASTFMVAVASPAQAA